MASFVLSRRISLLCVSLALFGLAACASLPGEGERFTLKSTWSPEVPRPNLPAKLTVGLELKPEVRPESVDITLTATLDGKKVGPITLTPGRDNTYSAKRVVFPASGKWTLSYEVQSNIFFEIVTQNVEVNCKTEGGEGDQCCSDAPSCGSGLFCIRAACSKTKLDDGESCKSKDECSSGICEEQRCRPKPTCDDRIKNAAETDVDCGGGTCGKCGRNKACKANSDCRSGLCDGGTCKLPPAALIGTGDGSKDSVVWTRISNSSMSRPADLAFHPTKNELWVVNPNTDTANVIFNPGEDDQVQKNYIDRSRHFMEQAVGISFSDNDTFGTCGDSRNTYDNLRPANDFMGPVLWPADTNEIDQYTRNSVHTSHLDMLHSTPWCMGIAAETQNIYFVFNGMAGTIDRYDFKKPHPHGGDDHSDGIKWRYREVKVKRIARVPSNLIYDTKSKWLYIADTGNGRVIRMNIEGTKSVFQLRSFRGDGILWDASGVKQEVVVKAGGALKTPSGLALHKDILYVSDNATGKLHAYDLKGKLLRSLDTGRGANALGGITVGRDSRLYMVDMLANEVVRIDY